MRVYTNLVDNTLVYRVRIRNYFEKKREILFRLVLNLKMIHRAKFLSCVTTDIKVKGVRRMNCVPVPLSVLVVHAPCALKQ